MPLSLSEVLRLQGQVTVYEKGYPLVSAVNCCINVVRVGSKTEIFAQSSVYCRKLTVTAMLVLSPATPAHLVFCIILTSHIRVFTRQLSNLHLSSVNGPYLLDNLMIKLRLPVVLYVSFAVGS